MITVRFPNGHSVQYNSGVQCSKDAFGINIWDSFDQKYRRLVAVVQDSAGAIIEWSAPCRIYDALQEQPLQSLTKEVMALKRKITTKRKR